MDERLNRLIKLVKGSAELALHLNQAHYDDDGLSDDYLALRDKKIWEEIHRLHYLDAEETHEDDG